MRRVPGGKYWVLAAAGILAGYGLGSNGLMPDVDITVRLPAVEAGLYQPSGRLPDGEELTLVYIGSSSCVWSNADELPGMIESLKHDLEAQAAARGIDFAAIGVAVDQVAADGLEHLDGFGAFDEVVAGRSWANTGVATYVYGDIPGKAATPQVIVLERTLDRDDAGMRYVTDRVLTRASGLLEIEDLVKQGKLLERR